MVKTAIVTDKTNGEIHYIPLKGRKQYRLLRDLVIRFLCEETKFSVKYEEFEEGEFQCQDRL